jgi:uncharacterized Zn-finger protein
MIVKKNNKPVSTAYYLVSEGDLPLSCPMHLTNPEDWSQHPKVYLPIEETGEAICPYCSAKYVMNTNS